MAQPKYRMVEQALRSAIERGDYKVGETIPREPDLAKQHGVSLKTVRAAVAELRRDNLLKPVRRRGTVVRKPPVRVALSRYQASNPDLGPWEAACAAASVEGRTDVKDVERVQADERVAELLGIPAGDEAVCRRRHHFADGDLAMVSEMWLRPALVDETPLGGVQKIVGGIYRAWVRLGWRPTRLSESVTVRAPTSDEARAMQLGPSALVLSIERVTRAAEGTVLEVLRAVASPEWVTLVYEDVPIPSGAEGAPSGS